MSRRPMVATARRDYASLGAKGGNPSRRLLSIVLGTTNENARANESQKLLNWGFSAFEPVRLFDAGQAVVTVKVWKGAASTVRLGQPGGVMLALPAGTADKITTEVVRSDPLVAPIAKGQVLAKLRVLSGGVQVAEAPLVALEAVDPAGLFGRAWDAMRLWIQ